MKVLFVNSCVRPESRTLKLAEKFITVYREKNPQDEIEELRLFEEKDLYFFDNARIELRNELLDREAYQDPMFRYANQIAIADKVIVAAPYWDLTFPAVLKIYLENAFVSGITFAYREAGPVGICKARKLLYITTAGGPLNGVDLGAQYMEGVCGEFGIPNFDYLLAEGLDVIELDAEQILNAAISEAEQLAKRW